MAHIPWGSRHLPTFKTSKLRACDFKAKEKGGDKYLTGFQITEILKPIAANEKIFIGLGIGQKFVHLDVDRSRNAEWLYN